ncbi:hypothetical protein FSOLCH5_013502 [Fusarium solani]
MVKSMSQLFVIGGTYTDNDACDLAVDAWAQHNFWTGTWNNDGDNKRYWAPYDPNVTSNVVPWDVYNVTGGDKDGGATREAPKAGFDPGNKPLQVLLGRRPSIPERSPTRHITAPTRSPTPSSGPALSTGSIVGIAVGGAVGLALVLLVWFCIGRRVIRRREERRQSQITQPSYYSGGNMAGAPSMVSPHTSLGIWTMGSGPGSPQPPFELPTQQDGNIGLVSELPQQSAGRKAAVSPVGVPRSQDCSPAPAPSLTPEAHTL